MSIIVNYEVYVMTSNGTWSLVEQFPKSGERRAFSIAKKIESEQRYPTKIVLSSFNNVTKKNKETILYMTDGIRENPRILNNSKFTTSPLHRNSSLTPTLEQKARARGVGYALSKLGLMILVSLLIAFLLSSLAFVIVSRFGDNVDSYLASKIYLTVFLTSFTLSILPLVTYFVPWQDFSSHSSLLNQKVSPIADDDGYYIPEESFSIIKKFFDFLFHNDAETMAKINSATSMNSAHRLSANPLMSGDLKTAKIPKQNPLLKEEQGQVTKMPDVKPFDASAFDEKNKKEKEKAFNPDDYKEIMGDIGVISKPEAVVPAEQSKPLEVNITAEHIKEISDFANTIIETIKKQHSKINNHGKNGLHLMIAGACEKLCELIGANQNKVKGFVAKSIELLGANRSLATTFAENLETYHYDKDFRYMIDIGSDAFARLKQNKNDAFLKIPHAFSDWVDIEIERLTKQSTVPNSESIVTIMFTDIVGSTKATQALGDSVAQNMIREHNRVVRNALKTHFGKEVKHTGDGIMASFMSAYKAVAAAIDIQKEVLDYNLNSETGTFPMMLRIGMNSGEPIVEDGDFFGATVQVAARVCSEAKPNQILVSSVVRELSEGKKFHFNDLGLVELRGIEEKKRLYEVIWNKD